MFEPYAYQQRLLEAVLQGENVLLQIPTGGGKTLGALLPFLQDQAYNDGLLPGKAIYTVPMRVLATQFQSVYQQLRDEELDPARFRVLEQRYHAFNRELQALQTGEMPDDPQFEALIVACTIDQLLASVLGVPYSVSHSVANLNVGAICGAYLILDEPHLYPLANEGRSYKGAFTTCLEMLRLFKGLTRFVFMSATMSGALVQRLSEMLDAKVITVDETELHILNQGRVRTIERALEPLSAAGVLQAHERCSLVVCNTVQAAQEMYLDLDTLLREQGRPIMLKLLHSRFTDEDRKKQGRELSALLGKEQWRDGVYGGEEVIVVATQVVEVGLDISVQTLHTQLSPANSLIQRAGRCARFANQRGRVIVYDTPRQEDGTPVSTLPYDAPLCVKTWQALADFEHQPMGFREEQKLVDLVHTEADLDLLRRYEDHRLDLQDQFTACLRTHERAQASELIRDATQIQLLIHDEPNTEITSEPWRWQHFSLHPSQFLGKHWLQLQDAQRELELPWLAKYAVLSQEAQQDEQQEMDSRLVATYTWDTVTTSATIPGALMLAMPQQLATYDRELGLVFLDGRLSLPPAWQQRLRAQAYQSTLMEYRKSNTAGQGISSQTYETHIGGLADAYYSAIEYELRYTMNRLEQLMGLTSGTIDHAIQLALALHDLGKLDRKWQRWARAWQRLYMQRGGWTYREPATDVFFAKTDYDYRSREQRSWQRELDCTRPHHACESVRIAEDLLAHSLGITDEQSPNLPVLRALCYAIAHHHTLLASEYGATSLATSARPSIDAALRRVRLQGTWTYDLQRLNLSFEKGDLAPKNGPTTNAERQMTLPNLAASREDVLETWLAFLITRALRLADQRADRYASK